MEHMIPCPRWLSHCPSSSLCGLQRVSQYNEKYIFQELAVFKLNALTQSFGSYNLKFLLRPKGNTTYDDSHIFLPKHNQTFSNTKNE